MNQTAMDEMHCTKKLEIVPNVTHLFEEAGALNEVARFQKNGLSNIVSLGQLHLKNPGSFDVVIFPDFI